jgi:putative Holliday junction resolvase
MKWMAIDYGDVRIGVAVSDPLEVTARGVKTIKWNGQDMATAVERIYDLMLLEKVEGLETDGW